MAPRQAALVNAQLNALQTALAEKGIPLLFHEVGDFATSVETLRKTSAYSMVSVEYFITISMK